MNPLQHMDLLLRYDRALNLRAAVSDAVKPGAKVLDAGCGLGLLSLWAAQAGAGRVVGVDLEGVELAAELARENGMDGIIEFTSGDLWDVTLPEDHHAFDVIFAMVYLNDPRRDRAQTELAFAIRDRFLAPGGRMVPDSVRYTARAADWPSQDLRTRRSEIHARASDLSGRYGIDWTALERAVTKGTWKSFFPEKRSDGRLVLDHARVLSDPVDFTTIDYTGALQDYPGTFHITVDSAGVFNTVIWTQELWYGEKLLFVNESVSWIENPRRVEAGAHCTLELGGRWDTMNTLTLHVAA